MARLNFDHSLRTLARATGLIIPLKFQRVVYPRKQGSNEQMIFFSLSLSSFVFGARKELKVVISQLLAAGDQDGRLLLCLTVRNGTIRNTFSVRCHFLDHQ